MLEEEARITQEPQAGNTKKSGWGVWCAMVLSVVNTVVLLYYLPIITKDVKPEVIREYIHEDVFVYQWLRTTHDPLDAWNISRLYFEMGQYEEACTILTRSLAQLSQFHDASILWATVLPLQIENIKNIQKIPQHNSSEAVWWNRWGIVVRGPKNARMQGAPYVEDVLRETALQDIRRQYAVTAWAIGE